MTEEEKINEMAKYICNACEMGCGFDGDCDEGSDYKTCGICQETAKKIYDEIICNKPSTDKETVPYFKAHPDVHKSKYINAPVVKVIGGRYEINSIDKIALVLGVKEAEE